MTTSIPCGWQISRYEADAITQLTLFRCVDCSRGLDELKRLIIQAIIRW